MLKKELSQEERDKKELLKSEVEILSGDIKNERGSYPEAIVFYSNALKIIQKNK